MMKMCQCGAEVHWIGPAATRCPCCGKVVKHPSPAKLVGKFLDECDAMPLRIAMARVKACSVNGVLDLTKLKALSPRWCGASVPLGDSR